MSDPTIEASTRVTLVGELMAARRAVAAARRAADPLAETRAREAVDRAKHALGERGPVWWTDGTADFNRTMVDASPYARWYAGRNATVDSGGAE